MIDPKKLRFRLIIVAILVILFVIGFLKNHVFALGCNTNIYQWNNSTLQCSGQVVGRFLRGWFGQGLSDLLPDQYLPGVQICTDNGSTIHDGVFTTFVPPTDTFASKTLYPANAATCPTMQMTICVGGVLQCAWTGSVFHLFDGSGVGICGMWGRYTQCDSNGQGGPWCNYHTCPEGKHLDESCACICDNLCNTPAQGGCQSQNSETCACECPEATLPDGSECKVTDAVNTVFNSANCSVCDAMEQYGTVHFTQSGVPWMPYPDPPGVTTDMMFYGTDKDVTSITWECLSTGGRHVLSALTDSLLTYDEIYPVLQANCSFASYNVPDYGGVFHRSYASYVFFHGSKTGTGGCTGMNMNILTQGFIGEIRVDEKTESRGTMYHSEGHRGFKNKGHFGGGYEVHMP